MRVDGLYFNTDEAKRMLADVERSLPPKMRKKAMPVIRTAMDDSAGRGMNGEHSCTSTVRFNGYQVTANVCCGGYAEVSVLKVSSKPII
jgi:hypothetical protein